MDEFYPLGLDAIFTRICGLNLASPAEREIAEAVRVAHDDLVGVKSAQADFIFHHEETKAR